MKTYMYGAPAVCQVIHCRCWEYISIQGSQGL